MKGFDLTHVTRPGIKLKELYPQKDFQMSFGRIASMFQTLTSLLVINAVT